MIVNFWTYAGIFPISTFFPVCLSKIGLFTGLSLLVKSTMLPPIKTCVQSMYGGLTKFGCFLVSSLKYSESKSPEAILNIDPKTNCVMKKQK